MSEKQVDRKKGNLGTVVVVGGNGNLGFHIINQIVSSWTFDKVISVDLRCSRNRNSQASYHECDITDNAKLSKLFEDIKPSVVIHTASPLANDPKTPFSLFKKVNVDGTQSVVEACQKSDVKALVYTSSASVCCNNVNDILNADERWPVWRYPEQTEYYSETKAAAEEIVVNANRNAPHKLVTCSLRPAGIFGEGDAQVTPGLLKVLRDGKSHWQIGENDNIFDFTYVGNVAHAHLLAARLLLVTAAATTSPLDHEKVDGECFFITNDSPVYFWDFARAVWRAAGSEKGKSGVWTMSKSTGVTLGSLSEVFSKLTGKAPAFTGLRARLSCVSRYYNITKAKELLGYEPLWTLQEGVERSVRWALEQETAGYGKEK